MDQRTLSKPNVANAVLVFALAVTLVGVSRPAEASPLPAGTCGCSEPLAFAAAGERSSFATVLARVVLVEGSPRSAHAADAANTHPYPWLRYMLAVEKRWGRDGPSRFWIERPWNTCGSMLAQNRRYLIALPEKPDLAASEVSGSKAITIDACSSVMDADKAGEVISKLGKPAWDVNFNRDAAATETQALMSGLFVARRDCNRRVRVEQPLLTMMPAETSTLNVTFTEKGADVAASSHDFYFAQDATRADGRGQLQVRAVNPTHCWLQLTPEIRSTWSMKAGVRRPFFSRPGLTLVEGLVPPFWSGDIIVDRDALWMREVRWVILGMPIASASPSATSGTATNGSRQLAGGEGELQLLSVEPVAGAKIEPNTRLKANVRWTPSSDVQSLSGYSVVPLFINSDGTMTIRGERRGDTEAKFQPSVLDGAAVAGRPIDIPVEIDLEPSLKGRSPATPLKLLFSLQKPLDNESGPIATTIVATTGPVEYTLARQIPTKPLPAPDRGVYYSGGDGTSCEEAVVIHGASTAQQGIAAERHWWRTVFPGSDMQSQGLIPPGVTSERGFDTLTLRLASGEERTVCFDITAFYGGPAR